MEEVGEQVVDGPALRGADKAGSGKIGLPRSSKKSPSVGLRAGSSVGLRGPERCALWPGGRPPLPADRDASRLAGLVAWLGAHAPIQVRTGGELAQARGR